MRSIPSWLRCLPVSVRTLYRSVNKSEWENTRCVRFCVQVYSIFVHVLSVSASTPTKTTSNECCSGSCCCCIKCVRAILNWVRWHVVNPPESWQNEGYCNSITLRLLYAVRNALTARVRILYYSIRCADIPKRCVRGVCVLCLLGCA